MKFFQKKNLVISSDEISNIFCKIDKSFSPKFTTKKIHIKHFPIINHYKLLKKKLLKNININKFEIVQIN
jgi:hypothetical protein